MKFFCHIFCGESQGSGLQIFYKIFSGYTEVRTYIRCVKVYLHSSFKRSSHSSLQTPLLCDWRMVGGGGGGEPSIVDWVIKHGPSLARDGGWLKSRDCRWFQRLILVPRYLGIVV